MATTKSATASDLASELVFLTRALKARRQAATSVAGCVEHGGPGADGSAGSAGPFLIVEERDYVGHELG